MSDDTPKKPTPEEEPLREEAAPRTRRRALAVNVLLASFLAPSLMAGPAAPSRGPAPERVTRGRKR